MVTVALLPLSFSESAWIRYLWLGISPSTCHSGREEVLLYTSCREKTSWLEKPGGPGGTFPSGPHQFNFLGGTRGDQYITKMGPSYFSWAVFQQLQ